MDAYRQLIDQRNWALGVPLAVCGADIDEAVLLTGTRTLRRQRPFVRGDDVRVVQRRLAGGGIAVGVDGVFGDDTDAAVRKFQQQRGLPVTGVVDAATRAALGL